MQTRNPHFCGAPRSGPLIDARREVIEMTNHLREGNDNRKPQELRHALVETINKAEHAHYDAVQKNEFVGHIRNGSGGNEDSLRRNLQRNKKKSSGPLNLGQMVSKVILLLFELVCRNYDSISARFDIDVPN